MPDKLQLHSRQPTLKEVQSSIHRKSEVYCCDAQKQVLRSNPKARLQLPWFKQ
jgi:hypothetical protein